METKRADYEATIMTFKNAEEAARQAFVNYNTAKESYYLKLEGIPQGLTATELDFKNKLAVFDAAQPDVNTAYADVLTAKTNYDTAIAGGNAADIAAKKDILTDKLNTYNLKYGAMLDKRQDLSTAMANLVSTEADWSNLATAFETAFNSYGAAMTSLNAVVYDFTAKWTAFQTEQSTVISQFDSLVTAIDSLNSMDHILPSLRVDFKNAKEQVLKAKDNLLAEQAILVTRQADYQTAATNMLNDFTANVTPKHTDLIAKQAAYRPAFNDLKAKWNTFDASMTALVPSVTAMNSAFAAVSSNKPAFDSAFTVFQTAQDDEKLAEPALAA
ncbi:MAG: hypothetical protein Q8P02_01850, partial [Candidatus Micrarchaeota archaeon]|nr:hypothetical protein [Candidatus Micrarchaeota archaeon]